MTLHIGDQFLSAGANDFKVSSLPDRRDGGLLIAQKARAACTTAWIANPAETVQLLDELEGHSARVKDSEG